MNDNNMSDTPFFSVLMLTYNSSWDKTRQTLYSVLVQKDVSFEIIIADDGSEENNFEKIRDYLAAWNFAAYSLVANERNQIHFFKEEKHAARAFDTAGSGDCAGV